MNFPEIVLSHLDNLWFQVSGTLCNIACAHCFNNSGPNVRAFGFLDADRVRSEIEYASRAGVKEIFFTGGEPFLHPELLDMLSFALEHAPTTVLTNGMLINDRLAERLAQIERSARYSLEVRVSLDGYTEEMNDAIRGRGVFRQTLAAIARLSRQGLLPLVTIVRTWSDDEELATLAAFADTLRAAGYERPRIKVLPSLPLGRELERKAGTPRDELLSGEMLEGFDRDLLMCSNSRIVTDRGIWVCPLLVLMPDARLGMDLAHARTSYRLAHNACVTCYRYGTICGNVSALIEGPGAQSDGSAVKQS
ncbi:MAG TPA: radical SAM protein [Terriglobia bacterium]|jgi:MoaA/NifB/PqqE/SkfB family radical SAM enzyme|nr:radical SAM protein [Terriglobia bacterium]